MNRASKNVSYLSPGTPPHLMSPHPVFTRSVMRRLSFMDSDLDDSTCTTWEQSTSKNSSAKEIRYSTSVGSSLLRLSPNGMQSPFMVGDGNISKYLNLKRSGRGEATAVKEGAPEGKTRFGPFPDTRTSLSTPKAILLPTIIGKHEDIPTISSRTMKKVLEGRYKAQFLIIDCRFSSEYNRGHIRGAKNYSFQKALSLELFPQDGERQGCLQRVLIFYCDLSQKKGPNMFRFIRERDRHFNIESEGSLSYPEMYLLDGGYKSFFSKYKNFCYPQAHKTL